jgi:hypothetical protein
MLPELLALAQGVPLGEGVGVGHALPVAEAAGAE